MDGGVFRLKACLNGGRRPDEHPAVPVTAADLAAAARSTIRAGAQAVHLHARDPSTQGESLLPADVGAAVAAVRDACPGVPIGVSTGLWITDGDVDRRQSQVLGWAALPPTQRPDFASVNLSEPGLDHLLLALDAAGVAAEAGVWSTNDTETLGRTLARGTRWLRVLVEIMGVPATEAVAAADEVLAAAGTVVPHRLPILLHGEEQATWPLVHHAARLGLPTRIGLEDTLTGTDGNPVRDNVDLVEQAVAVLTGATAADPGQG